MNTHGQAYQQLKRHLLDNNILTTDVRSCWLQSCFWRTSPRVAAAGGGGDSSSGSDSFGLNANIKHASTNNFNCFNLVCAWYTGLCPCTHFTGTYNSVIGGFCEKFMTVPSYTRIVRLMLGRNLRPRLWVAASDQWAAGATPLTVTGQHWMEAID